jgi:glycolate oxidase iron-sulfur subunit
MGHELRGHLVRERWIETAPNVDGHQFLVLALGVGVQFCALMEGTRTALATAGRITPWWQRLGFRVLGHHRTLLAGSSALAVAQRMRVVPRRLGVPPLPLRRPPAVTSTAGAAEADVWLVTGCVMDAWQRETHRSAAALITLTGATFAVPGAAGACCGALHVHAGLHDDAAALARGVIDSMPGDAPILVDSAGCGAAMKDYGHLLGTPAATRFSERVLDIDEWLAANLDRLPAASGPRPTVIVQDPCHLRHVQRTHESVRTLLAHVADVVELDDDGLCCGAGGAYSALEPDLAGRIRERKVAAIAHAVERSGATVIASANPGCASHLAAAGLDVRHPLQLVEEAIRAR